MKQNTEQRVVAWLQTQNVTDPRSTLAAFAEWSGFRPPGTQHRKRNPGDSRRQRWYAEWAAAHPREFEYYVAFAANRKAAEAESAVTESDPLRSIRRP